MATTQESLWRGAIAGFLGGACQTVAGQPFDTIKVRMQTAQHRTSLVQCVATTLRGEGVRGLYHGVSPALLFGLIENTMAFAVNEQLKRELMKQQNKQDLSLTALAACGAASGFAHCCFSCPTEVVKCRLQVVGSPYKGPIHCLSSTLRSEGLKGLYSGFLPFVLREVPFYLVFFASYEMIASSLQRRREKLVAREDLSALEVIFAGGFAGCIGWSAVLPSDTVKTMIQTQNDSSSRASFIGTCLDIKRSSGVRGFFPGWTAAMLRAFPANAALFVGFEGARRTMTALLGES
eukprot:TRINITY_DN26356_c0_g1_i1.p1 TRINITY_DN26356_c0_g1~~TRINITY_DN26356_c0_g1_i1.p1  ORF type:complete len:292 (+),score=28.81 TRINITY_DN26356_c0_g1_i1:176-1051(+)